MFVVVMFVAGRSVRYAVYDCASRKVQEMFLSLLVYRHYKCNFQPSGPSKLAAVCL